MQPDAKQNTIVPLLNKLRAYDPRIGEYKRSIYSVDMIYYVKVDNGRVVLTQEILDDFEKHADFVTEEQLKNAAKTFRMDASTTPDFGTPQAQTQQVEHKGPKRSGKLLRPVLIVVAAILGTVAIIFIFLSLRENELKNHTRSNIRAYVTASGSTYLYSELGGISDFSVTVTNRTKYVVDQVRVKVTYIKSNGGTWKEEFLDFNYILPFQSETIKAPDSERGTKLQFEIVSIVSYDLSLY